MDKRTIIAIAVAALLFVGYFVVTSVFFPSKPAAPAPQETAAPVVNAPTVVLPAPAVTAVPVNKELAETTAGLHNKMLDVVFSNKGGVVTSVLLNDADKDPNNTRQDDSIQMVFATRAGQTLNPKTPVEYPFSLHFGDYKTPAVNDLFEMTASENKVEFARDFQLTVATADDKGVEKKAVKRVKVKKTFELVPDQYLMKMFITLESAGKEAVPFDFKGILYTLGIGPQIGPEFPDARPDDRSDYRHFVILTNSGRKEINTPPPPEPITESFTWAAVSGKYYALIASTDAGIKDLILDSRDIYTPFIRSAMYFERKREITQALTDEYTFFYGPKKNEVLASYKDSKYSELAPIDILGYIAEVLKYPLDFFAKVGNYGLAIIILTLVIKILLFPLTRKSYDSMKKMQGLNPKLKDLREKYKDNPKRLNEEMAALYKKEGISPLGGCLPQLLQLPILFGLYQLFNTHFALKNAIFIPGWINDLSVPDSILKLPFATPPNILGFVLSDIRLLPIIMLVTQLASTFFTQGQTATTDSKMKYLPYIMMAVFFFVLYNLPSGLVLYWTVQNILTVLQMVIQKLMSDRKDAAAALAVK